jgi:hypothetical protein
MLRFSTMPLLLFNSFHTVVLLIILLIYFRQTQLFIIIRYITPENRVSFFDYKNPILNPSQLF